MFNLFCSRVLSRLIFVVLCGVTKGSLADYSQHPLAQAFVEKMHQAHDWRRDDVLQILRSAKKQSAILEAIARPAEKALPWHRYRKIFLGSERISAGIKFWAQHAKALTRAEKVYGVSAPLIVAIIGVETRYGKYMGRYRVLDALTTLGFDYPPRADFFRSELEHFLLLTREQQQDIQTLKGSYAGAMGYGQFISSSYRNFAVDFDGDGIADIWKNPVDAIGSVANYLKAHDWKSDEPVAIEATLIHQNALSQLGTEAKLIHPPKHRISHLPQLGLSVSQDILSAIKARRSDEEMYPMIFRGQEGAEAWLGFHNLYVITRYNHSPMYALAVWQLSEAIDGAMDILVKRLMDAENEVVLR